MTRNAVAWRISTHCHRAHAGKHAASFLSVQDTSCQYFVWNATNEGRLSLCCDLMIERRPVRSLCSNAVWQGIVQTCSGSAPSFSKGAATQMLVTGVRGSALATLDNNFSIQLNAQPLCEADAYLAKAKVAGVDEAIATCRRMDSCAFFGFVAYNAKAMGNLVAHFCSGPAAQTISQSGWVTGLRAPLFAPPTPNSATSEAQNGPLLS